MSAPVVVVGSGLAGMVTALRLAPTPVLLVSPQVPGRGGSTELAQGGLAAAVGVGDAPRDHAADTHAAGAGLCDAETVARVTGAGPAVVAQLAALGVAWDRAAADGAGAPGAGAVAGGAPWALGREGGHGRHRIVHVGDRTGAAIAAALSDAVSTAPHITHLAGVVTEVCTHGHGRVTGVVVRTAGGTREIGTDRVVLATGGYAGLYAQTTNPATNRGAGLALAARAGARLADLEFVQFHPTALDLAAATAAGGSGRLPLLTEALRGAGAVLLSDGERFVDEIAPRDVVAAAVHAERRAGRRVELDCRTVPGLVRFTALAATAAAAGLDARRDGLPVCPAAHYSMGGVLTDARARTDVPGLWAVGEVACTGLHGANRLASNSLLEAAVAGQAAAEDLAAWSRTVGSHGAWRDGWRSPVAPDRTIRADAADLALAGQPDAPGRDALVSELLSAHAGVVRTRDGVEHALVSELLSAHAGVVRTRDGVEDALAALTDRPGDDALVARLLLRSALRRANSVGGHRWAGPEPAAAPPAHAAPGVAPGATLTASGTVR
ncbi:FAD-binding protein [Kytococcus sedentarius]|uniref:FAD-binding protein n=1 Tax=Kytococcus sedentarius TaxID=1276 RepID=UPI0035BC5104